MAAAALIAAALNACAVPASKQGPRVAETRMGAACSQLTDTELQNRDWMGLGAAACPAPPGIRLFIISNETMSWPTIEWAGRTWSAQRVTQQHAPGIAPQVGLEDMPSWLADTASKPVVVWSLGDDGAPQGLAYLVRGTDPDADMLADTIPRKTRLLVIRLTPAGGCLLGAFDDASGAAPARALVASERDCPLDAAAVQVARTDRMRMQPR